jgi:hypothetical protein
MEIESVNFINLLNKTCGRDEATRQTNLISSKMFSLESL